MKRAGHLYAGIAEPENLRLAFMKAIRGKRGKPDVIEYTARLEENLRLLRDQLLAYQVDVGHYHFFTVHDPKERVICAASFPERVLHHAIINVCEPALERYAIYDSYACRAGKGGLPANCAASSRSGCVGRGRRRTFSGTWKHCFLTCGLRIRWGCGGGSWHSPVWPLERGHAERGNPKPVSQILDVGWALRRPASAGSVVPAVLDGKHARTCMFFEKV